MIDSTIVRAHRSSAGAKTGKQKRNKIGRSCGGLSTKIHAKIDEIGRPLKVMLSTGNCADIKFSDKLIGKYRPKFLLADKGYDSDKFRENLRLKNICPVIPGRRSRKIPITYDKELYKKRNVVERFFCKIKDFRRIATRYEKRWQSFLSMVYLACIIIYIRI